MNLNRHIHSGWRRGVGLFLIISGVVSASFYYVEMHTIAKGFEKSASLVLGSPAPPKVTSTPASTVSPKASVTPTVNSKIKLSTATQAELESLPKIGPTKARAIIEYRNKFGFKTINDLNKVKGIGPKTVEILRPLVEL